MITENSQIKFGSWLYNVADHYKNLSKEEIINDLNKSKLPISILMAQVEGDFNFGSVIRSANAFNVERVFYYGKRKYDKRAAVGTYHYTSVEYLNSMESLFKLKEKYSFIALENNINKKTENLVNFKWHTFKPALILAGEEGKGLPSEILDVSDYFITIPMRGSVRSLNVSNAVGMALYDFYSKVGINLDNPLNFEEWL